VNTQVWEKRIKRQTIEGADKKKLRMERPIPFASSQLEIGGPLKRKKEPEDQRRTTRTQGAKETKRSLASCRPGKRRGKQAPKKTVEVFIQMGIGRSSVPRTMK